jgi:hypothetical protein
MVGLFPPSASRRDISLCQFSIILLLENTVGVDDTFLITFRGLYSEYILFMTEGLYICRVSTCTIADEW